MHARTTRHAKRTNTNGADRDSLGQKSRKERGVDGWPDSPAAQSATRPDRGRWPRWEGTLAMLVFSINAYPFAARYIF